MRVNVYWTDMKSAAYYAATPGPGGIHVVHKNGMVGLRIPLVAHEALALEDQPAVTFWAPSLDKFRDLGIFIHNAIDEAQADMDEGQELRNA